MRRLPELSANFAMISRIALRTESTRMSIVVKVELEAPEEGETPALGAVCILATPARGRKGGRELQWAAPNIPG